MDYSTWLHDALHTSQINTNTSDLIIHIWNERDFEQARGTLVPTEKTVNIILKSLANDISYYVITQPYEISVWSEANDIQETQALLDDFVNRNNFLQQALTEKNSSGVSQLNIYKHSYSSPIMLDPFTEQGNVIRAMFLVSAYVTEIQNVADVKSLNGNYGQITVNGTDLLVTNFSLTMVSNPNTRMISNTELASSVIEGSVVSIAFTTPCVINDFTTDAFNQMQGSANSDSQYSISFSIGNISFSYSMKISSSGFSTQPNAVPSLVIGMIL